VCAIRIHGRAEFDAAVNVPEASRRTPLFSGPDPGEHAE
jgi:hypothetical protein